MRQASVVRKTAETNITATLDLDGKGDCHLTTGIGFLDHMLEQVARHGRMDLILAAEGDLHVDFHHTTEDVGIVLGQAFKQALGARTGIRRYGSCLLPMDDALARVALDLSNRPFLFWSVDLPCDKIGTMDTELFREWFHAFAMNAGITLHVEVLHGVNAHHMIEACFKALARALRDAIDIDPRQAHEIPSTKGVL